jgi:hypothetical protein
MQPQSVHSISFPTTLPLLQAILDVVVNLQFQMVENLWRHFWAENPR